MMNLSGSSLTFYKFISGCCLLSILVLTVACKRFDKSTAEKAINRYVQRTFYRPDTYKAVRYYDPRKTTVSTDPADRNNTSLSKDKEKNVDGWAMAVDIRAITRNGEESSQSAAFYLTAKCDSVIFSDIAPQFMKADSLSMFGATH